MPFRNSPTSCPVRIALQDAPDKIRWTERQVGQESAPPFLYRRARCIYELERRSLTQKPNPSHICGGVVLGTLAAFSDVFPTPDARAFVAAGDQLPAVEPHTPAAALMPEDRAYSVLIGLDSGGAFCPSLNGSLYTNAGAFARRSTRGADCTLSRNTGVLWAFFAPPL